MITKNHKTLILTGPKNGGAYKLISISKDAEKIIGIPDKIILLTADLETLNTRIANDSEHKRPKWLIESMNQQIALYNKWSNAKSDQIIKVDTTSMTLEDLKYLATDIIKMF